MDNGGDILQLCRLCLVKDEVNIPIFEEQGDIRQIFLKISSCLPVKVNQDDKLPKKICDGCSYKLDMFYEFWNSTANAEKQLLAWLGEAAVKKLTDNTTTAATQQIKSAETVVKQEALDPSDIHTEENDDVKGYMFQQKFSEEEPGPSATATSNDEPPPKRARRTAAVKAQIAMDPESDDDDDSGEPLTKVEDESEESEGEDHEPTFVDVPSTSADDQPGPSGVGKDGAEAPLTMGLNNALLPFECGLCGRLYPDLTKLKRHASRAHRPNAFSCEICERPFRFKHQLDVHVRNVHLKDIHFYKCELCDKKCSSRNDLRLHTENVHMNKYKLHCPKCDRGFNGKYQLDDHIKRIHANVIYTCKHCGKMLKCKNYYKTHLKTHDPNYKSKRYQCSECPRVLKCAYSYNVHMKIHNGYEQHMCDVCGKIVTTKSSLRNHMRIHTGEKPFQCEFCEKQFTTQRTLVSHRRVHTKERPFICKTCGKGFTQKTTLNIHNRYHTGERPYECSVCLRKFVTKSILKDHKCKGVPNKYV